MDWIDYREKLGIGFNDNEKGNIFIANILTTLNSLSHDGLGIFSNEEYFKFQTMTGSMCGNYNYNDVVIKVLTKHTNNFLEFLAYYIAIINSKDKKTNEAIPRKDLINAANKFIKDAHIPFDVFYDEDNNYFIFPKGAEELDDALISEPLRWLEGYPKAHKTFCNALKQYSEGIYIRDVADNLRKALEEFLQEFLGNEKNLETNKVEICKYLGEQDVDSGISGLYQSLINSYKNINDRIAKHHDKIDEKLLEFLLYQTGILIRMTITVKNAEK